MKPTTLIEQTSKPLKAAQAVSVLCWIIGAVMLLYSQPVGALLFLAGMGSYLWTRVLIWWHHG